jgi:transcription antitermination factor NusG
VPTWREVRDSSAVVILVVLILLVFLATSDIVLARVSDFLLFGRSLFGTQLMTHKWYSFAASRAAKTACESSSMLRLKLAGVSDIVPQVLVPFERVTDLRAARSARHRKLYPGYLMLQADLAEPEHERTLKATAGCARRTRWATSSERAASRCRCPTASELDPWWRMSDTETRPQISIGLQKGDMVKIKAGAFDGFDGPWKK